MLKCFNLLMFRIQFGESLGLQISSPSQQTGQISSDVEKEEGREGEIYSQQVVRSCTSALKFDIHPRARQGHSTSRNFIEGSILELVTFSRLSS